MADIHETYMARCIALARLGEGHVAPNPMVGAVLVHDGRIIGEGYHEQYGEAHAEVNCINSVSDNDRSLIESSSLYVSLEPCAHFGKTPPCSDLIIRQGIKNVFIGCRDPFVEVDGKGMEKLQQAGVQVTNGVLENECRELNKRFLCFHTRKRPYIVLKWAQTSDGFIAADNDERLLISNDFTNRLVHQWRSAESSILVGTNTALKDDPSLDNRLYAGPSPVRMVVDLSLRLPASLKLFNQSQPTIVFNSVKQEKSGNIQYSKIEEKDNMVEQIAQASYRLNIQSILVEGGAKLLQSFIDTNCWDEARIITNKTLHIGRGLNAPVLKNKLYREEFIGSDLMSYYHNH